MSLIVNSYQLLTEYRVDFLIKVIYNYPFNEREQMGVTNYKQAKAWDEVWSQR